MALPVEGEAPARLHGETTARLYQERAVERLEEEGLEPLHYGVYGPRYRPYRRYPYYYYQQRYPIPDVCCGYRHPYYYRYPHSSWYSYRRPPYADPYDYFIVPDYIGPNRYGYPRSFYRDRFYRGYWD